MKFVKCTPQELSQIQQRLQRETRLKLTQFLLKIVQRHTGLRAITAPSNKQPNMAYKLSQLQKIQLNLLTVTFLAIIDRWSIHWSLIDHWSSMEVWKGQKIDDNRSFIQKKTDQLDGFRLLKRFVLENSAHSRNQSDCRICWIPPAHQLNKKTNIFMLVVIIRQCEDCGRSATWTFLISTNNTHIYCSSYSQNLRRSLEEHYVRSCTASFYLDKQSSRDRVTIVIFCCIWWPSKPSCKRRFHHSFAEKVLLWS